jgi:hypothetical protein
MTDEISQIVMSVIGALLSAGFGGLSVWMFKLDERVFTLSTDVATRAEIDRRLDAIEKTVNEVAVFVKSRRELVRRGDLHEEDHHHMEG